MSQGREYHSDSNITMATGVITAVVASILILFFYAARLKIENAPSGLSRGDAPLGEVPSKPLPPGAGVRTVPGTVAAKAGVSTSHCGVERWDVKTLTDPDASRVDPTPRDSSPTALLRLGLPPSPVQGHEPRGVTEAEFSTYIIEGKVVVAKVEADSDVHIAVEDDNGIAVITEIPAPECAKDSRVYYQILQARIALLDAIGAKATSPTAIKRLIHNLIGKRVRVTGVGFMDKLHGQSVGSSDEEYTGIELHPVEKFEVLQ